MLENKNILLVISGGIAAYKSLELIRLLRDNCDMVVMDCGRAGAPETWPLARLSDTTLLVSRKSGLGTPGFSKSVNILNAAKVAPVGLIVTR